MTPSLETLRQRTERTLAHQLDHAKTPARLREAMQYSCLNGGKRVRALLVYATGQAVSASLERLDYVAAAMECIHAYSLIHDDLPAMDDDQLRRGEPCNHLAFDEATAILAGDALQTLAFELVNSSDSGLSAKQSRNISVLLARAAGRNGMVGGQMLDIQATGQSIDEQHLTTIHRLKTGALIEAAVLAGAACGEHTSVSLLKALKDYASNLGLAFQVMDDVLDVEGSTQQLGKTKGADAARGKTAYPDLIGLSESKTRAKNLYQSAIVSLSTIGDNTVHLETLAELVVNRQH